MKRYLEKLYASAAAHNKKNIFSLLEQDANAHFLDLGCDDGKITVEMAKKIGTQNFSGVEIQYYGQIQPALLSFDISNITAPFLIYGCSCKILLNDVRSYF